MTQTGQLAMALGMEAAAERDAEWMHAAREAACYLASEGNRFTADDICAMVGRPNGSGNAVGALFHQLAKETVLEPCGWLTSIRPERRGAVLRVWRAAQ